MPPRTKDPVETGFADPRAIGRFPKKTPVERRIWNLAK
jgi:hypothetical protein